MAKLPKRAVERIRAALKRFQPILITAKSRDVHESDTVVIVIGLLHEIFGYDKYTEITSEQKIKGTFCDLAVKLDGTVALLIEVKAIGLDLKEQFVKQAIDYAANQGVEWVALTNGAVWRVYKVSFAKPIQHELVVNIDLLTMNLKKDEDIEMLGLLAKEGWRKDFIGEYHTQRQALSRFTLGALILSQLVLEVLRRELKKMSPDVRIETDSIKATLEADVIKREVLDGEKADAARKQVAKVAGKPAKTTKPTAGTQTQPASKEHVPSADASGESQE